MGELNAATPPMFDPAAGWKAAKKVTSASAEQGFLMDVAPELPTEDARFLFSSQAPTIPSVFTAKAGDDPAWLHKPSYAIVATNDRVINPDLERSMCERAGSIVTEVDAGHMLYISHPEAVAKVIVEAVQFPRNLSGSASPFPGRSQTVLGFPGQGMEMRSLIRVAIAGFGGVGRATASLLLTRRNRYRQVYGANIRLVAVCGSRSGLADPDGLEPERLDALEPGLSGPDFIMASGADILIEAGPSDFRTGGPGLAYIRSSLSAGRDTIVISKGALVHSGPELRALARSSGAMLKLSGAAAAALPTIDLLEHSLKGCEVLEIEGILNATTNYLLDAMMNQNLGFDEALARAQAGGFAEADPRNDTEGWDTASKLLILANFGLDARLTMDDLVVEGIQSIAAHHIETWRKQRLVPKLVGSLIRSDGATRAAVGVRTYPPTDPLAHVSGKNKAIRIATDAMGETIAIGSGTEPLATAAAALKDLEHILTARAARATAGSGGEI